MKNKCLNFFKGIACLFVISHHVYTESNVYLNLFWELGRFAVPFFILISGYFSYNKEKTNDELIQKAKASVKKFIKYTLAIIFLYLSWNVVMRISDINEIVEYFKSIFNINELFYTLVFNKLNIISSIAYYTFMMVYVELIYIWILRKKKLNKPLLFVSLFLLLVGMILPIFIDIPTWQIGNWILCGLPMFLIGALLRKYDVKVKNSLLYVTLIISLIFSACVVLMFNRTFYYDVGTIGFSVSLFLLCINNSERYINKFLVYIGEKLSMYIFIFHCIFRDIVEKLFSNSNYCVRLLLVILFTLIFCFLFDILNSRLKNIKKNNRK